MKDHSPLKGTFWTAVVLVGVLNAISSSPKVEAGGYDYPPGSTPTSTTIPITISPDQSPSNLKPEDKEQLTPKPTEANPVPEVNQAVSNPVNVQPVRAKPLSFSWETWGNPYRLNQNICRDKEGNIICVASQIEQRLRWNTSPPK